MLRKLAIVVAALLLPGILAAQAPTIPGNHASETAQAKMAAARARVAEHRAAHVRGWVTHMADRNPNAALPATPATPTQPGSAIPAMPAQRSNIPAMPAPQSNRPTSPGQSGLVHRP